MLAFAAFVPHPLISVPEIGKKSTRYVRRTVKAYAILAQELYAAKPDILFVISPHRATIGSAFTINQRPELIGEFSAYGDLSDRMVMKNDLGFGYRIKESLETKVPILLVEEQVLDYGTAIPLFHLTKKLNRDVLRVVCIGTSSASPEDHYEFGRHINRHINKTIERIAVIGSGDLSHGSSHRAVTGYSPHAAAFNKLVRAAVEQSDVRTLLSITKEQLAEVQECGLRVLMVTLGIIHDRVYRPDVKSYETSLGIGYLTVQFHVT